MDKIFSTRIDDAIIQKINDLSMKMRTSKKAIIENAVKLLGHRFEQDKKMDIFDRTCGIWNRKETPDKTLSNSKTRFSKSMKRHHR